MILFGATDTFNYGGASGFNYGGVTGNQRRAVLMGMVLLLLALLVGCASVSSVPGPAPVSPTPTSAPVATKPAPGETPTISKEPGFAKESITPQAGVGVLAMLQKAEDHTQTRKFDLAIATLERALRLEPRNPWIWHRLAVVHLQQKNRPQAAHLASKSNALIGDDHPLRTRNNSIIVKARQ